MNSEQFLKDPKALNLEARTLAKHGFRTAALFYLNKNEPLLRRISRVVRCIMEECELPSYKGTSLYPCEQWTPSLPNDDKDGHGLKMDKGGTFSIDVDKFSKFVKTFEYNRDWHILNRVAQDVVLYSGRTNSMDLRYGHGHVDSGHWVMDHAEVLRHGLIGYEDRILDALRKNPDDDSKLFYEAMLDTVEGLISLNKRMAAHLKAELAKNPSPELERLAKAYENVPTRPASSFFEALVSVQFFMFYAVASEPGRMDQYLYPFYMQDLKEGRISEAEASALLDALLDCTEKRIGPALVWHLVVGGSEKNACNELTTMILRLSHRRRQPNVSLRVRADMSDELWDEALKSIGSGGGHPSLVNDELIQRGLVERIGVPPEDAANFAFGGCSETIIPGRTFCQSLLTTFNVIEILEECLRWDLPNAKSFDEFYKLYKTRLKRDFAEYMEQTTFKHLYMATHHAEPLKTLLTGGCLERRKGYYQGGPDYNFESMYISGVSNVVNSLIVLKACFAKEIPVSPEELLQALRDDYEGGEKIRSLVKSLPKFGNDDAGSNALAAEFSKFVFNEINSSKYPDGRWVNTPSIIAYTTFVFNGMVLGATPDGRKAGDALADSCGPAQGTDVEGPGAVLKSAASLAQRDAPGTCVLNMMLDAKLFKTREMRDKVKGLFKTCFKLGGMQLQVSVMDRIVLEKAAKEPEKYSNLIVRIGGYCDYFSTQHPPIREEIVKRSMHEV